MKYTNPAGPGLLLFLLVPVTGSACDLAGGENCSEYRIELTVSQHGPVFAAKGDAVITEADVDAYLEARVPEKDRSAFLADPDRIGKMLRNLAVPRQLTQLAVADGLHEQPEIQPAMIQGLSTLLADEYLNAYAAERMLDDYEAVAREDFLKSDRQSPAKLDFTQLMIVPEKDRLVDDMREVVDLADRLEDDPSAFDDLVAAHSDDPALEENQGRYRDVRPSELVAPIRNALLELEAGELSGVVQSQYGLHILRLDGYEPARSVEFEDVRDEMIEKARANHLDLVKGRLMSELDAQPLEIAEGAVRRLLDRYNSDFGVFDGTQ